MGDDHDIRASDRDREAVVNTLRDAYAAGRLTLEEFDERTTAAYAGRTWGELRALTRDLPEKPELGADISSRAGVAARSDEAAAGRPDRVELPKAPPLTGRQVPPQLNRRRLPYFPVVPFIVMWALAVRTGGGRALIPLAAIIMLLLVVSAVNRHWRRK